MLNLKLQKRARAKKLINVFLAKATRAEELLFQLFLLLIPTQLAYHFWPKWAFVFGIRVDYLSPTIYFTDVLIALLLLLRLARGRIILNWEKVSKREKSTNISGVLLLASFALINIFLAGRPQVAFVKWIKIAELGLVYFYFRECFSTRRFRELVKTPLMLGIIYSSVLAMAQFVSQKTIGGLLYFIGERNFSALTPGIAMGNYFGRQLLRPYATFPHPNVLAGYILIALIFVIFEPWKKSKKGIVFITVTLGLFVMFLSMSLSAWMAGVIALFILLLKKINIDVIKPFKFIFLPFLLFSLLPPIIGSVIDYKSIISPFEITTRIDLSVAALKMIVIKPMFGVGLNNFIPTLVSPEIVHQATRWLQPAHNAVMLITAELGVVGLSIFVYIFLRFTNKYFKENKSVGILIITAMLTISLVDHYWVTLQQTQLLATMLLAYTANNQLVNKITKT